MSVTDPLNPSGFLEDFGTLTPEKPPAVVQKKKKEGRSASKWQVWIPTGHRVRDKFVPLLAADLSDVNYSPVGAPQLELVPDEALIGHTYVAHVDRNPAVGRLTLNIPDSTAKLMDRISYMLNPVSVQRRNYCDGVLQQIEHYDQVFFGPVQADNLTATGPQARDAVPMVNYTGLYQRRAILELGGPDMYIYRRDATIEYGISDLAFGSNMSKDPEPCSVLWLLLTRHTGTPARSYLYRTLNSRYYRRGAPYIVGGEFQLIHSDAINDRIWGRMFEHRGRVWLISTPTASYDGITIIDQVLDDMSGLGPDDRFIVSGQVVNADTRWKQMAVSGHDSNIMYLTYWHDVTDLLDGIGDGVLKSVDHGLNWTMVHSNPFSEVGDALYGPICAAGNFVAIGAEDIGTTTSIYIQYSNEAGEPDTWFGRKTVFDKIARMAAILPDETNPDRVFVYTLGIDGDFARLIRSDNLFTEDVEIFNYDMSDIGGPTLEMDLFVSLSGDQIWVRLSGTPRANHYIFRSEDRGANWTSTHIFISGFVDYPHVSLAVCGDNPDHAAAGY